MEMSSETKNHIDKLFKDYIPFLETAFTRWQEEGGYEDWDEYSNYLNIQLWTLGQKSGAMEIEPDCTSKKPLGISFRTEDGWHVDFCITAEKAWWEASPKTEVQHCSHCSKEICYDEAKPAIEMSSDLILSLKGKAVGSCELERWGKDRGAKRNYYCSDCQ